MVQRTRKKNSKKQRKIAIKANAAGKKAESRYARNHLKQKLVLTGKGIPDIITFDKNKLVFYEIKPHLQRTGYSKNSRWRESHPKQRLLNSNQKRNVLLLIFLIIIGMFLETLGVGLIIPIFTIILNNSAMGIYRPQNFPTANDLYGTCLLYTSPRPRDRG